MIGDRESTGVCVPAHALTGEAEPERAQTVGALRAQLAAAQARLGFQARLLDAVGQAVIAADLAGSITHWNHAAESIYGWRAAEVLGRSLTEVLPSRAAEDTAGVALALARGEAWSGETIRRRRDGTTFPALVTATPIPDESGASIGIIDASADITARRQEEQARARLEEALARAKEAAEELARLRQEQAMHAEAMAAVGAALASTLDPQELYTVILEQASRVLPYDHAAVLLYRDDWAVVASSRGRLTVPTGARAFRIADIADVAANGLQGRPALIRDTMELGEWVAVPPFVGEHTIRSVLVAPLIAEGRQVGTFNVDSFTPAFYTERHLATAMAFAERVAQALRNARLFELERERVRAAAELARLRSDFVMAVSHELRTPLTAMVGIAELLQARWDKFSEARRLERIGQLVQAANRQQRLVEDLLLVSRLEGAGMAFAPVATPLAGLVAQAAEEVRAVYPGQAVALEGPAGLRVWADPARTGQILANLLDNAAKYSPEGSPIAVCWGREKEDPSSRSAAAHCEKEDPSSRSAAAHCEKEDPSFRSAAAHCGGELATVRVRDRGPGIREADRARLFTRFGRLPGSAIRAGRVGTGLGLYLSRELAQAMGGDLELESSGPAGSTFRLRLPASV